MFRASIGNGVAKELIRLTRGHQQRKGESAEGVGGAGWRGAKGVKEE